MTQYAVSVSVPNEIADAWLTWMQSTHIPDVLRTGCFKNCTLNRVVDPVSQCEATFVIQYFCESAEIYRHYQTQYAPALQKEHTDKFAGKFRASRQVMEVLKQF